MKAAFLFRFTQYVDFPARTFGSPDAPVVIGVASPDPFGDALVRMTAGRKARGGRPIRVRAIERSEDLAGCHVVFIPSKAEAAPLLEALRGKPVLLVGEREGFARDSGVVEFILIDGHVRFEVNNAQALARELRVASAMLDVASRVFSSGGAR